MYRLIKKGIQKIIREQDYPSHSLITGCKFEFRYFINIVITVNLEDNTISIKLELCEYYVRKPLYEKSLVIPNNDLSWKQIKKFIKKFRNKSRMAYYEKRKN